MGARFNSNAANNNDFDTSVAFMNLSREHYLSTVVHYQHSLNTSDVTTRNCAGWYFYVLRRYVYKRRSSDGNHHDLRIGPSHHIALASRG